MSEFFGFDVFFKDEFGENHLAGKLIVHRSAQGGYRSGFSYDDQFRNSNKFPDLCPFSLKRSVNNPIEISRKEIGIPCAFEDAIPDAWGRALLARAYDLNPAQQDSAHLLQLICNPIGALTFKPFGQVIEKIKISDAPYSLEKKIEDALQLSNAEDVDEKMLRRMLTVGTASGGARPKFIHENGKGHWLVKPSVKEDKFPMIRAESMCLKAASMLGLRDVGDEYHNKSEDEQTDVLLIKRFDITEQGGRKHMVSMRSIMGRDSNTAGSYQEMAEHLIELSNQPEKDAIKLHRLMLLNCAVGNIDDHLKNFAMIWSSSEGWRLSPAYDITPAKMTNPEGGGSFHSIGFFKQESATQSGRIPNAENLQYLGKLMGVSEHEIGRNIEAINDVVGWMKKSMSEYDINEQYSKSWVGDIDQNLALLSVSKT